MTKLGRLLRIVEIKKEMKELEFEMALLERESWGYLKKIKQDLKELEEARNEVLHLMGYK